MNQELRLYTFVNFYLSSIQQGIQSAHIVHSLFVKYPNPEKSLLGCHPDASQVLWDWAKNHKTMIVLNGGMNSDIHEIFYTMEQLQHTRIGNLPFECFQEDEMSLGSVMTSVGVVVPQKFYEAKKDNQVLGAQTGSYVYIGINESYVYEPNTPEYTFIDMLKNCGLAR